MPYKHTFQHYILWINNNIEKYWKPSRVKSIIFNHFNTTKLFFFMNIDENQSIPDIKHYHIFILFE